jgi:transcriptional regulator with XRE-family HTH domain
MTFGKRLRSLRKQKNMTQKDLADIFKLSESTIGMYERDEREPSFEFVKRIADLFNVTTDYLLGRTNDSNLIKKANILKLKNPELVSFFKELDDAPIERREQLLEIWKILNRNSNDKQK